MPNAKVLSEKQAIVAALTEKLQNAAAGLIVDYKGITVAEDTALRADCRENNVDYAVVKNTLLRFAFNNVVKYDDQHAWLVSDHQVLSCRISNERVEVLHKSPVILPMLGNGLAVDGHLYVSSRDGKLLRFRFDNLQPDSLRISSPHYTNDTATQHLMITH